MDSVDWAGVLIGGGITLIVSLIFYIPSAISLKRETAKLRRHTTLILRGLEEAGLVEYNRDGQTGEIIGMVIKISAASSGVGSASATPTVGRDAPSIEQDEEDPPEVRSSG